MIIPTNIMTRSNNCIHTSSNACSPEDSKLGLNYDQKNHECVKKDHGKETYFLKLFIFFPFEREKENGLKSKMLHTCNFNKNDPCVYVYMSVFWKTTKIAPALLVN